MKLEADALAELAELEAGGTLSPERVLQRAKKPTSALHPHFEWDDAAAAREHRLAQAERLIIRARVSIVKAPEARPQAVKLKALPSPPPPRPAPRPAAPRPPPAPAPRASASPPPKLAAAPSPRALPVAFTTEPSRLTLALKELSGWILRYGDIPELAGIIAQVHRVHADARLREAVAFARQLEQNGLDRRTAADRAAAQFDQHSGKVIELLRAG